MATGKKQKLSGWGNYPMVETRVTSLRSQDTAKEKLVPGLIPRGLGRSYADQAINEKGITLLCQPLNKFLSFDESSGILECEAGVSLEEIINVFAPRNWFPAICPGTKFVTIGGAIANDIHGKAHHADGSFVNCVHSFTILTGDGEIRSASRSENADLFWANFGGLGLLGIILTARVQLRRIETTYFTQKPIRVKNLEGMLNALHESDKEYNYSVGWIDPLATGKKLGSGVLTVGNGARLEDLPPSLKKEPLKLHSNRKINIPFFLPNFTLNGFTTRIVNAGLSYLLGSGKPIAHYEKFFFPLDMFRNWNRGYGKRGFIQYQFVIPKENNEANLHAMLEMIAVSGCTPFLNVFKTMGKEQGLLSFPFEGYTLAIDFPMSEKLKGFIPKLDQKVMEARGRIYLGKDALLDKATFRSMYPQVEQWRAIKTKYDPANLFSSHLSQRLGLESLREDR